MRNSLLQLIKSVSNAASVAADNKLRHLDISLTQYFALDVIVNNEGTSIADAAKQIGCDRSTLSRALSILIRDGYVARKVKAGADARNSALYITKKGNIVHESAKAIIDKLSSDIDDSLPDSSFGNQAIFYFSTLLRSFRFVRTQGKRKEIL